MQKDLQVILNIVEDREVMSWTGEMTVGTDGKMRAKKVEQTQFQFRRKGLGLQREVLTRPGARADGTSAKREGCGGELGGEPEFRPSGYKVSLGPSWLCLLEKHFRYQELSLG